MPLWVKIVLDRNPHSLLEDGDCHRLILATAIKDELVEVVKVSLNVVPPLVDYLRIHVAFTSSCNLTRTYSRRRFIHYLQGF